MKEKLLNNLNKIITFVIVLATVIGFLTIAKTNKTTTASLEEIARKVEMTYDVIPNEEEYADEGKSVKFGAFYTQDLNYDSYAEKMLGSCNQVNSTRNMYIEIGVEKEGYLKDGVITINGKNFTFGMEMLRDTVLKKDYISSDIGRIELNDIHTGTQEILIGKVKSKISSGDDYSRNDNTVTLTGTFVPDEGDEIPISKTYTLTNDWYGTASTSVTSTSSKYLLREFTEGQDIRVSYSYTVKTTGLLPNTMVADISVPALAGFYPTSVIGGTYDEENHTIHTEYRTSSEKGTYDITLVYPAEAYEPMRAEIEENNVINLRSQISAYSLCHNNPNEGFENPYRTGTSTTTAAINIRASDSVSTASHECNVRFLDRQRINYPTSTNAMSKKELLEEYDKDEPGDLEYRIEWLMTRTSSNYLATTIDIEDESMFGDSFDDNHYLGEVTYTKAIAFANSSLIPSDGTINIYEVTYEQGSQRRRLVKSFENGEWEQYTDDNPYVFDTPIKDIRIITSEDVQSVYKYLCIHLTRAFDVAKMKELNMRSTIANARNFKTAANFKGSNIRNTFTVGDTCAFVTQETYAKITAYPEYISTAEEHPVNQKFYIDIPEESMSTAKWTNGIFVLEIPADKIAKLHLNSVTSSYSDGMKIVGEYNGDVIAENGKYYIKIFTNSTEFKNSCTITIDTDIQANPISDAGSLGVKLHYLNEECRVYMNQERDSIDINGNGNTTEPIGYTNCKFSISAPNAFVTTETISNYNEENDITVAPNIANVTQDKRQATVNVLFANHYVNSVSNVKVLGKIPFAGNKYIDGDSLKSEFSTTMTNEGIKLPSNLEGKAQIYYSTNENPTKDLTEENGWKISTEWTSLENVKSYLVVINQNDVKRGNLYNLSYTVNIPEGINSNKVTYSCHKVFFELNTDGGILESSVQPSKLGLRVVNYYDFEIDKCKKGSDLGIQGATYQLLEDEDGEQVNGRMVTSDNDGKMSLTNLKANQIYYFKEIKAPNSCELNEGVIKFRVNEGENGTLSFELLSETSFDGEISFVENASGRKVLRSKVEDLPKVRLTINKLDKDTRAGIGGVMFGIESKGSAITNYNGKALFNGISVNTPYVLRETQEKKGYYKNKEEMVFTVNFENNVASITSDSSVFQNAQIKNTDDSEYIEIEITIENEKIPTYKLNVVKVDEYDSSKKIANTRFLLKNIQYNEIHYYTTNENGVIELSDLYQYVEGKDVTGEYILQEASPADGYLENYEEIKFVVSKREKEPEEGTTVTEPEYELFITVENEDSLLNYGGATADGDTINLTITNKPLFKVRKFDSETGEPLAKVEFVIYEVDSADEVIDFAKDNNKNYVGTLNEDGVYVVTTDEYGEITAPLRSGRYKLVEYKYAHGYQEEEKVEYFVISGNRQEDEDEFEVPGLETNPYAILETKEVGYIEDLVDMQIASDAGENYSRVLFKLTKDLDFEDPNSYRNAQDTSYGDINGNGVVETILEELTNKNGIGFTPIGDVTPFCGIFAGQNHELRNIYINRSNKTNAGLFGKVGTSGAIYGSVQGLGLTGTIKATNVNNVGAIVANSPSTSRITNCYNKANITVTNTEDGPSSSMISGIGNGTFIDRCYNEGNITVTNDADGAVLVAGIGGFASTTNCYNRGNISIDGSGVGQGAGIAITSSSVSNCYNTGNVVVEMDREETSYAQGIGFRTLSNSYYLDSITLVGQHNVEEQTKTSEEMKAAEFVETLGTSNWLQDTNNVNDGYPILSNCLVINSIEDLVRFSYDYNNYYEGVVVTLARTLDFNDDSSYINPNDISFGDINEDGNITGIKDELTDTNGKGFMPIGRYSFRGIFDGNGYEINNLYINRQNYGYYGLFSSIQNAHIKDITVSGNIICGGNYGGGICGYVSSGYAAFENCINKCNISSTYDFGTGGIFGASNTSIILKGCENYGTINAKGFQGGLAGYAGRTSGSLVIDTCKNHGDVISTSQYNGGFVGECYVPVNVIDSYNYGAVIGNGSYSGGFFGIIGSDVPCSIYKSGNEGTVAANGYYIGGLIGECLSSTNIRKSYNSGNIIRTSYTSTVEYVGGLVGRASFMDGQINVFDSWNSGSINISAGGTGYLEYIGGLLGSGKMNAYSCYNTGDMTIDGGKYVGGIAGNIEGIIKDTYNVGKIIIIGSGSETTYQVGGISGQSGNFENCTNKGEIYVRARPGDEYRAGGISGDGYKSTFNKVYNEGNILVEVITGSTSNSTYGYVGGISGTASSGQVTDSYNKGSLTYKNYETKGSTVYIGGINGSSGDIVNSYNEGEINVNVLGYYQAYVGGIIGAGSTVSYSYNIGPITVSNIGENAESIYAGGIAGRILGVDHSYNTGTIKTTNVVIRDYANNYVGGIAGYKSEDVTYCYNTGDIESTLKADKNIYDYVGGVVGYGYSTTNNIKNCYNTGNVTSTVTPKSGPTGEYKIAAGGVTGYTEGTVQECYNTGKVTNDITMPTSSTEDSYEYVGGVNGYAKTLTKNCYNLGEIDNTLLTPNGTTRNEYVYVGGVNGFGKIDTCYNEGAITNSVSSYTKMHSYTGGVVGDADGSVINAYNKANIDNKPTELAPFAVEYYSGGIAGKTGSISNTYNVGQLTNTYGGYIGSPSSHAATYQGPVTSYATEGDNNFYLDTLTVPEGSITSFANASIQASSESYMKDGEMYDVLQPASEKWTEVDNDYPILDLTLEDIDVYEAPDLSQKVTEIEVENTKKTYDITTEIKPNTLGLRIGGTITGEHTTDYPEATGIKYVETRKYTESNTVDIVATPEDGYRITSITINGEEYEFDKSQTTSVTIPAGYINNIDMNYHVIVTFSPMDEVLEINKVDENGNPLEGAEFSIEQVENRAEPDSSYFGEMTGTGPNYDVIDQSQVQDITNSMQQGGFNATSGYYFVRQSNGTYRSNNNNKNSTTAGSYMEIDLTNESDNYMVVVNALISSEPNCDTGKIYLMERSPVSYSPSPSERFVLVSGYSETTGKDYKTPVLHGGRKYYLAFEYSKDSSQHKGYDRFTINSVKLYKCSNQSFGFVANGDKYESNNTGNEDTKANSSMSLDLRNYRGKYKVTVNAEQSGKSGVDYGKINVTAPGYAGNELCSLNGTVAAEDYSVILDGGRLYSLDFEYSRGAGTDSDHGSDKMTINSINIELDNSDFFNETGLVTDENGKITVALGYGKYKITETKAPEGYENTEGPVEHTIASGTNNSITITNSRLCEVITHYYMKETGPEYGVPPVEVLSNKYQSGRMGTPYTTSPVMTVGDYTLLKENGDYVRPSNATGQYGIDETGKLKEQIDVYYYYDLNDVGYTVHYLYDNVEDHTYEAVGKIGDIISTYPDGSRDGFELIEEINLPLTLTNDKEQNHIYIMYVRKFYNYSIHYYYENLDGEMVEDTSKADEDNSALFNSEILEEDIKDKVAENEIEGFTHQKSEALNQDGVAHNLNEAPLVIGSNEDNNRINVYYSRNELPYEVHYFFDGEDDESLTKFKSAKFEAQISTYEAAPADKIDGYKLEKARALNENGEEVELPLIIKNETDKNRINVYYVKDNFDYTIEYYYDNVKDESKTVTGRAEFGSVIDTYEDKVIDGYKFDKTENKPMTITSTAANNVMKVYYVKDNFDYTIEYYYDNVKDESKTVTGRAEFGSVIDTYEDKVIDGYKFDKTENKPMTITSTAANNVMKVYYVKDNFDYTIEYYYDNVKDESKTVTGRAEFGSVIDTYEDKVIDGYKFDKTENKPMTITSTAANNVMKVFYVKGTFEYEVHYFYEGVEDTSKAETGLTAVFGTEISSYTDKNIPGYKLEKTRALDENGQEGPLPLVIKSDKTKNRINIYYIKDELGYEVHYFYDGVENTTLKEGGNSTIGERISDYTDKCPDGYKLEKAKALNDNGEEVDLPLIIKVDEDKNIINVYYIKDNFDYTIEYYYDNVKDESKTVPGRAEFGSVIDTYEDKVIDGYKFDKTENKPMTITSTAANNVMKVYYVKDNFDYTIEYYYDNVKDESKTVQGSAEFGSVIDTYEDKVIDGYKFDKTENKPMTITSTAANNVMKVFYVKDNFDYTIEYYYDNVKDESKTVTGRAEFGSVIDTYEDKVIDGYKFDKTENKPMTITSTAANNVMKVFYVKDNFDYTIEYYYDNVKDESKTVTGRAEFGSVIDSYEDKNINGYKLDRVENKPMTITSTAANNVMKVFYVKNNFGYTIEYYYDNVKDDSKTIRDTADVGSVIDEYEDKNIDGYKLDRVENKPMTITSTAENNVMKVFYVKETFGYEIHYFYEGVEDESKVERGLSALFGSEITEYPDKVIEGYKLEKAKALNENGEEGDLPLVIKSDPSKNIINVYYIKKGLGYEVHYFYDGVEDPLKQENKNSTIGEQITEYEDKSSEEYRLDKAKALNENGEEVDLPLIIRADESKNIINVYYVHNQGRVIVEYVDNLTGEKIKEDTIVTGNIGDDYSIERIDISGHRLDEDNLPDNESGKYKVTDQTVTYKYIKLRPYELLVRYTVENGDNDQAKVMVRYGTTQINDYTVNGILKVGDIELTELGTENYTVYETETPEYCKTVIDEENPAIVELTRRLNMEERKYEFVENHEDIDGFDVVIDDVNKKVIFDIKTIKNEKYDLALRKFISKIGNQSITDREPKVEVSEDNKITYVGNDNLEKAINNQDITYTIRMYNESDVRAKGKRVIEHIPDGLVFDPNNGINKQYGWVMCKVDENGTASVTENPEEATMVVSDYLVGQSITAFNAETKEVSYLDIQVVFKVDESKLTSSDRIVENKVEIMKNSNDDNGDNDITTEKVYIKYFDLSIEKYIEKVTVNTNGKETTEEVGYDKKGELVKVDVKRSEVNSTKLTVTYGLVVKNVGEIPGYATEITDYVPENFKLAEDGNWTLNGNIAVSTSLSNKMINPGESETLFITFEWNLSEGNIGERRNEAEITAYANEYDAEDITKDNKDGEDLLVSIKTGSEVVKVVEMIAMYTAIFALGVYFVKRKVVIRIKK